MLDMRRRMLRRSVFGGLLLVSVAGVLAASCSNQGMGQRCDRRAQNSGNDDCEPGLVCVPLAQLSDTLASTDTCCPVNRAALTSGPCAAGPASIADAAAPAPDAEGPADDGAAPPELDAEAPDGAALADEPDGAPDDPDGG